MKHFSLTLDLILKKLCLFTFGKDYKLANMHFGDGEHGLTL